MPTSPIFLLLIATAILSPIKATDTTDTASGDQFKCGGCPCNNPCATAPPPPPPPPKKPTPTPAVNCPPPPAYIFITGPPGNLYPVDPYSKSTAGRRGWAAPSLTVVAGVLGMLALW